MRSTLDRKPRPWPPIGARIRFAYHEHHLLLWEWHEGIVTNVTHDLIVVGHYYIRHSEPWYLA